MVGPTQNTSLAAWQALGHDPGTLIRSYSLWLGQSSRSRSTMRSETFDQIAPDLGGILIDYPQTDGAFIAYSLYLASHLAVVL